MSPTAAQLQVNLKSIETNYLLLRQQALPAICASVVKADAYGLGMEAIVPVLYRAGCRHFFVAHLSEALTLRTLANQLQQTDAKDTSSIWIGFFHGVCTKEEAMLADAHQITPIINSMHQWHIWQPYCQDLTKPVWIHADTGMQRLGFDHEELSHFLSITQMGKTIPHLTWMTHLACADTPNHPLNHTQWDSFFTLLHQTAKPGSIANSSGIFHPLAYKTHIVRPGCALYGINPTPHQTNPMHPVISLHAPLLRYHTLTTHSTIGYGATISVPKGTTIGVIPLGYADGLLRSLSHRAMAYIDNLPTPILGRISMDLTIIDLTNVPKEKIHPLAMIELIGPNQSIDQIAFQANTIGYEILTSFHHPRMNRIYHFD
jgi:alanine racemase